MSSFLRYFCLLILLLGQVYPSLSQPIDLPKKAIVFDHPNEALGLSQQTINCMIQDKDGYLWLGTWTGLILYDGYETTVFQSDNFSSTALKSNKITSLLEDKEGFIWVGTMMGGLYKYDKNINTFTAYQNISHDGHSLSSNNIWSIVQDNSGKLWIGTENGLNHFDPKTGTSIRYYSDPSNANSLNFNFVTSLYLDHKNNLWIGTEKGVNQLDLSKQDRKFIRHHYSEDEESTELHNYVYKITSYFTADSTEAICWSTKKGLKILLDENLVDYQVKGKEPSFSFFRALYTYDHQNNYLLLGSEMGLSIFDIEKREFVQFFGNYDETVGLSHNTVTAVFIDKTGVLWVGTKKGINKFDTYSKNFDLYLTDSFDPTKSIITGLALTPSGNFWVSTMGGGIYLSDKTNKLKATVQKPFKRYHLKTGAEDDFTDFVQKLYADKASNIWIGSAGSGVYTFNEKAVTAASPFITAFKHYHTTSEGKNSALSDNYIMAFGESKDGGVWVGTWSGGINKIMPDGQVLHYQQAELTAAPIVALHEDTLNVLWIGTRGKGLLKASLIADSIAELQVYKHSNSTASISNDFINDIYEDHNGKIWIGTEGGLDVFDREEGVFKSANIKNGNNVDVVVSLLEDNEGRIWYAHWKGITVFDPTNYAIVNEYDRKDRIQGGFFYNGVSLKDTLGNLYFGGSDGFNIIYPEKLNKNPFQPKVNLRYFRLFNEIVNINESYQDNVILEKPLSKTDKIYLKHNQNSISLEFSALHFSAPEKNKYAYRMKGFEEDWEYTDANRRYANYTNLPDGNYVFEVKASNGDGVWSDEITQLAVEIYPPWYKTWYANIGYIVAVLAMLYFFRRFIIIRTNYINDIKLERINRENIEKLNKAKLQFFTNVSHEFRTPLTLILGPLEKIINSGDGGKIFKDQLNIINRNAQRLLRLVNQLLDFRKAEAGKLKLKVTKSNIVAYIKEIKLSFEGLAEEKKIRFVFNASSNDIQVWFDEDQFEKILFNLLSNAFNHTPNGGEITIAVAEEDNHLLLSVEDNGSGIKPEHFKKIFKRFHSEEELFHQGTGIGLALTKSLVELHHGRISVESIENEFSKFTINIPLGRAHFKESQIIKDLEQKEFVEKEFALPQPLLKDQEDSEAPIDNSALKKILVVEDNAEIRAYIKSIFHGQYHVLEAENGHEGLLVAEAEAFEVILSDVMMPGMDGIAFCKHIKENIRTSHIPVILLTARTSMIFRLEGLENGADDYITKPFNAQILQLKIRNLIKSREELKRRFMDNEVLEIEPKKVTLTSTDADFIQKALESIEQNMSNSDFSVEEFGKDVGMSRMQLYRKLKALTGLSANEFIRSIRLKRAAQLLELGQLTVAEVTYEVGFTDLQYFRNCFKKQFDINPSEYKIAEKKPFDDFNTLKRDIYPL